ncbi:MAG: hypothetical protein R3B96_24290 [Pirellulaceae bacterium]
MSLEATRYELEIKRTSVERGMVRMIMTPAMIVVPKRLSTP